jgi:DNA-binding NarL/FixJ family response regulator
MRHRSKQASTPTAVCFLGQNAISLNYLTHLLRRHEFQVVDEQKAYERQGSSPAERLILALDDNFLLPGSRVSVRTTRFRFPRAKLLILANAAPSTEQCQLLRGIDGLVLYAEASEKLLPALRALRDGRMWFPRQILEGFARLASQTGKPAQPFTERETEIFQLMREGLVNKEIANRPGITEKTVKFHVSNIFAKQGVHDRNSAIELAHSPNAFRKHAPLPMQRAAQAA